MSGPWQQGRKDERWRWRGVEEQAGLVNTSFITDDCIWGLVPLFTAVSVLEGVPSSTSRGTVMCRVLLLLFLLWLLFLLLLLLLFLLLILFLFLFLLLLLPPPPPETYWLTTTHHSSLHTWDVSGLEQLWYHFAENTVLYIFWFAHQIKKFTLNI